MNFSCLQEHINKAIVKVSRGISSKPQLPILSSFLMKAEEGRVTITATNLETTIISSFPAKIEQPGSICLPARLVTEFLSTLSKDTVFFIEEQEIVKVSCGRTKATLPATAASEFPPIPAFSSSSGVDVPKTEFIEEISSVLFSAAQDEARPLLMGMRIEKREDSTALAATDGYRLSLSSLPGPSPIASDALVVPARALSEVLRISGEEKDQPTIRMLETVDGQLVFSLGETYVVTRRIDGEYPNYRKIIPSSYTTDVQTETAELLRAVKSAALFARESAGIIKMSVKEGMIEISANTPQVGENVIEIDADVSGEDVSVAVNSRFFLEFLHTVKTETITIQLTGALTPVLFKLPNREQYLHIIMPVRVQG